MTNSHFKDARILVTGGGGFIGSHLTEALVRRGAKVAVIDDFSTGDRTNLDTVSNQIDLIEANLITDDLDSILEKGNFGAIFHLAASAYVPPSVEDPGRDLQMNIVATFRLLEAVRATRPETPFLYTSTAAVYGEGFSEPLKEGDPTFPIAPYAVSKLAAEHYVAIYSSLFGLRTSIARLFSVFGPRLRKQVVYDLMRKVHDDPEHLTLFGDGSQARDFNYVTNVVEALLYLSQKAPFNGERHNIAGDKVIEIRDMAQIICKEMGASPELAYTGDVRPGDTQRWIADTTRLQELGFCPETSLAEGVVKTVAWFREEVDQR